MSKYLYRLGHWCVRRRRTVLVAWIVVLFGVGVLSSTVGGPLNDQFSIPGTESQQAMDLLEQRFPQQSGSSARVVFAVEEGKLTDAGNKAGIEATLAELNGLK